MAQILQYIVSVGKNKDQQNLLLLVFRLTGNKKLEHDEKYCLNTWHFAINTYKISVLCATLQKYWLQYIKTMSIYLKQWKHLTEGLTANHWECSAIEETTILLNKTLETTARNSLHNLFRISRKCLISPELNPSKFIMHKKINKVILRINNQYSWNTCKYNS